MTDLLGKTLGNYRIDRLLGEGGMGAVYQAYDISLQREVAIKLIHPHLARRADFRERFIQEARVMARLDHPGIVKVHMLGKEGELLFLPMEYIRGGNLRQLLDELIRQRKWIPLREAVLLVRQLCQTVEYAHQKGVLHRDIKPANLMLKPELTGELPFRVVLTDLGLAKLAEGLGITQEGTSLGTPAYMSPEQASGQPTDPRSDVYSLGILLYELGVGRLPFLIKTLTDAVRHHSQVPPPTPRSIRPGLPEWLEHIILKALEKDPSQRYASAAELGSALTIEKMEVPAGVTEGSTETVESDTDQDTSLITEYEKSIVADVEPEETSLSTIFGGGSFAPRGESVFGDESILPSRETRIQIVEQGSTAKVLTLRSGIVTIGRDKSNQIMLADEKASRRHAQITWDGSEYHVMDLNSSNGTYLEDVKLLPGVSELWRPDHVLRIGDTWLRLLPGEAKVPGSMLDSSLTYTRSSAGLVGVSVTPQHMSVEPGGSVTAQVALINQSHNVDHFTLSLTGIPSNWVASLPPGVQLMPSEQKGTAFTLRVPRSPDSQAGSHPLKLTVTSQRDPSQFVELELTLIVAAFSHFTSELRPKRLQSQQVGRLSIFNHSNQEETFTVTYTDEAEELNFVPPQAQIKIAQGQSATTEFRAAPRQIRWIGKQKSHSIQAQVSLPKAEPQTLHAELLSRGVIPPWLPPFLLLLCLSIVGLLGLIVPPLLPTPSPTLTPSATPTPSPTLERGAPIVNEWCVYAGSPPSSLTGCPVQVSAQLGTILVIEWRVSNADEVVIEPYGSQGLSGRTTVTVFENMPPITLKASNAAGKIVQKSVQINGIPPTGTPVPPTAVPASPMPPSRVPPPTQPQPPQPPTNTPTITPTNTPTFKTHINVETGFCLDSNYLGDHGDVYTLPCNGGNWQNWDRQGQRLVNVETGFCLDSNSLGDVYTLPCNGGNWQNWIRQDQRWVNVETGFCLDSNYLGDHGDVYTLPCNGGNWQNWR